MLEKQKNIRTCITIENGKRYGKTKKKKKPQNKELIEVLTPKIWIF